MQVDSTQIALFTQSRIPAGTYTSEERGIALVKQMNGQLPAPRFASEYRQAQHAIVITWLDSYIGSKARAFFTIYTNRGATGGAAVGLYPTSYLTRSIKDLFKNYTAGFNYVKAIPSVSGYLDMNPIRNVYFT